MMLTNCRKQAVNLVLKRSSLPVVRRFAVASDAKTFVMPKLSPTMTRGRVIKWYHKEGDLVKARSVLCEIVTKDLTQHKGCEEKRLEIEVRAYVCVLVLRVRKCVNRSWLIVFGNGVVLCGIGLGWRRRKKTCTLRKSL